MAAVAAGLAPFLVIGLLFSCQSLPPWVLLPPGGDDYFIGVGNSNIGNKNIDYDMALKKARVELAKSIEVEVAAQTEDRRFVLDSQFESQSRYEKTQETVNQHLEMVEIADTYYSKREGWWFFLRIPKAKWEAMVALRRAETEEAVQLRLQEALTAAPADAFLHCAAAYRQLLSFPFAQPLRLSLPSGKRPALPYLRQRLFEAKARLRLRLTPPASPLTPLSPFRFTLSMDSPPPKAPFPLSVSLAPFPDSSAVSAALPPFLSLQPHLSASENGSRLSFSLPVSFFSLGSQTLYCYYGNEPEAPFLLASVPVFLEPLSVRRSISGAVLGPFPSLQERIESQLPLRVCPEADSEAARLPLLRYRYHFSLLEPTVHRPLCYAGAQLSAELFLPQTGRSLPLFVLETPQVGGRNWEAVAEKIEGRLTADFLRQCTPESLFRRLAEGGAHAP